MIRTNSGATSKVGTEDNQMVLNLSDKLNLPVEAEPISTKEDLVESDIDFGTPQIQRQLPINSKEELPPITEDEAVVLRERQDEIERVQTLQDRFGLAKADFQLDDIVKVFGKAAPRIEEGLDRLRDNVDQLILPFGENRKQMELDMLGFPQKPKVLAEGEIDTDLYIDKARTKKLTQSGIMGHLGAVEYTSKADGFKVKRDWDILSMATVEGMLIKGVNEESVIPEGLVDVLGKEEASKVLGMPETELTSAMSDAKLGRTLAEEWVKLRQRAAEGPDVKIDAHENPDNFLTKEAYEMLGLMAKQAYSLAHPALLKQYSKTTSKGGGTRVDYLPTLAGLKVFSELETELLPPKPRNRPQLVEGVSIAPGQKRTTGNTVVDPKDKKRTTREEEAVVNLGSVRHAISSIRLKVGMFLAAIGIGDASTYSMEGGTGGKESTGGRLVLTGLTGNLIGCGQKMADTINDASANMGHRIRVKEEQLILELKSERANEEYIRTLREDIVIMERAAAVMATDSWKKKRFMQEATKSLAMMQDIAEFRDSPIGFTHYIQQATSRIGVAQQTMSIQNNKMARQMFGSGTKYTIAPGTNSNPEKAMLITMGAHFFTDANNIPDYNYRIMRDRVNLRDKKLMKIAEVGRKLKALFSAYDSEPAAKALMAVDTIGNKVSGVSDVIATSQVTQKSMLADPDVKAFILETLDHPNESVNLIEEAIELANYMDAVDSGKPFVSQMRPIEVDGITNGFAGLAAQLGIMNMMYKVGVLSINPNTILAEFDGVAQNIRKELARNMEASLDEMFADPDFVKEFKLDSSQHDFVRTVLALAIANETEFLKPPIMTMPYGQAISSMSGTMIRAVMTSKELKELADNHSLEVAGVARMLHKILEKNLIETLGQEVVEFSEAVKAVSYVAMAANEPILIEKPTGSMTSFNTNSYRDKGGSGLVSQMRERGASLTEIKGKMEAFTDPSPKNPSVLTDEAGNPNTTRTKAGLPSNEKVIDALGKKSNGAPAMRQGMLAQGVIMIDGAVVTNTLSGKNWTYLKQKTRSSVPYVSAIYDAVVCDLGSFIPIMEQMNQTWKETVMQYDLIKNIKEGAENAMVAGEKKLKSLSEANPDIFIEDQAQAQNFIDMVSEERNVVFYSKMPSSIDLSSAESILKSMKERSSQMAGDPNVSKDEKRLLSPARVMTNKQALALYTIFKPIMKQRIKRMDKLAKSAKERRMKIEDAMGNRPIHQYAVDALKSFKFPNA
tara:strand:- start:10 stop:3732 length:3723 start_codon:yes stop_codon:yes gene_type:complete